MKKYIFLIILLLSFIRVNAKEVCDFYNETLIDIGYNYFNEDENLYFDKNDYTINYGEWQEYNGEQLDNIEVKTFYKYKKIPKVRYIHFYNVKIGSELKFRISELKVFDSNNNEIDYNPICGDCYEDTLIYINDNNYDFDKQVELRFIYGHIIIDLLDEYEVDDININLYLNDNTVKHKMFYVGFSNGKNEGESIVKKYMVETFTTENESKLFEYKVNDTWEIDEEYLVDYESDQPIEDNIIYKKDGEIEKYRLYDIKYKTYLIEKECNKAINSENENNDITTEKEEPMVIPIMSIQTEPVIQNLNVKSNTHNVIETKEEIIESTVTSSGSNTYKEVKNYKTTNQNSKNKLLIMMYILIIIFTLITLYLLTKKKLSYKK